MAGPAPQVWDRRADTKQCGDEYWGVAQGAVGINETPRVVSREGVLDDDDNVALLVCSMTFWAPCIVPLPTPPCPSCPASLIEEAYYMQDARHTVTSYYL